MAPRKKSRDFMSLPRAHNPENEQIPQYVRLTSVLRNRLLKAEWKPGDRLPNIDDFVREYGLGRNTVRQALGLLIREGLIASTRGRGTFVAKLPDRDFRDQGLIRAINDPLEMGPGQSIRVLKRERVARLPEGLEGTAPLYDGYMRVLKLHLYRDTPFSLQDIYVASVAYDKFPRRADAGNKLLKLVIEGGYRVRSYRQEIIVTSPDVETAQLLEYSMASPLVQILRWRTDTSGQTLTAGRYLYRADLFILNIEEINPTVQPPGHSWVSPSREKKKKQR